MKILKVKCADGDVANKPGMYKNFNGDIRWHGNEAMVRNATFKLNSDWTIDFISGDWLNGTWYSGKWKGGKWHLGYDMAHGGQLTTQHP